MLHILVNLTRQFRAWEQSSQIGFILAILLMLPALVTARNGPEELQWPATIAFIGLTIAAQGIFMWANRGMVTPYARAQRFYRNADFEATIETLVELKEQGQADFRVLTLLGNAYRQVGSLSESETVLFEAVNICPDHYFPHYGFGRTLLTQGRYDEAAHHFEMALRFDAPVGARFDLAEALYRAEDTSALSHLQAVQQQVELEPYRALMTMYLLHQRGKSTAPDAAIIRAGLPFWEKVATLYAETPYGAAVTHDVETMSALLKGE